VRLLTRHDPFWDVDGVAARRVRRRNGARSVLAFAAAFVAVVAASVAWAGLFGLAPAGVPTVSSLPGFDDPGGVAAGALGTIAIGAILLFVTGLSAAVGVAHIIRGPTEAA